MDGTACVGEPSNEDLNRLANRVAMLASEGGEAEAAGRAVSSMARRLGLSGGDLRQIFSDGLAARARGQGDGAGAATLDGLRRQLRDQEAALRGLLQERDQLAAQVAAGRQTLVREQSRRPSRGLTAALVACAAVVILVTAAVVAVVDEVPARPAASQMSGTVALVRGQSAVLFESPDPASHHLAVIRVGARLPVRRVLWHMLTQWAEVEADGRQGYMATTDLEIMM